MLRARTLRFSLAALLAAVSLAAAAPVRAATPGDAPSSSGDNAARSQESGKTSGKSAGVSAAQKQPGQPAGQSSGQAAEQANDGKKRPSLPPGLFTSTLPSIPGRTIRESLGFHCQVFPYSAAENYMAKLNEAMAAAQEKGKSLGANGFVNISISSAPLGGLPGPGKPQKIVQGVPVPAEMLDGPPPADVIIHICGDFVRYE